MAIWACFNKTMVASCAALWLTASTVIAQIATNEPALNVEPTAKADSFKQPATLAELLALPVDQLENVDIALISLLCAEGLPGAENLNVQGCLDTLETWTRHIQRETKRNFHRYIEHPEDYNNSISFYQMGMLGTVLAEDLRIQYNPELEIKLLSETNGASLTDDFFRDSKDVFLHGLLTGKHFGTCASMPFLYASIGRRLGYPVTIAARKRHLYIRFDEGNGKHLNVEATENLGFSTPSDEEYRNGPFAMTEAEIQGMGWLRPLNNKEVLAICLFTRTACLHGNKRYDEEIKTLHEAGRYAPDTSLVKHVIQERQNKARMSRATQRWDELWNEVENQHYPTGGPKAEYFRERKQAVQKFMNQSTNLSEIEKSVEKVKAELQGYRRGISDDIAKMTEAFNPKKAPSEALLVPRTQVRRVTIARERVPVEYWNGIPPDLMARLRKLTSVDEMVIEMNAYHAEEANLHNQEIRAGMNNSGNGLTQLGTEYAARSRRTALDQEPLTQPPLQIEIVPSEKTASADGILPLTGATQTQITPTSTGAGKP